MMQEEVVSLSDCPLKHFFFWFEASQDVLSDYIA